MLSRAIVRPRLVGGGFVAACGVALMTAYCQLSGSESVPFNVSFSWALLTLANWLFFGTVLWSRRDWLMACVEEGRFKDLLEAVAFVFAIGALVTLLSTAASTVIYGDELLPSAIGRRLFTLSPILMLVAVAVTASFAAWQWRQRIAAHSPWSAPMDVTLPFGPASSPTDWIELPEAPLLRLRARDVAVIRTARNYCQFEIAGRSILVRVTAKRLEQRLAPLGFARVHRAAIVNLSRVRVVQPGRSGQLRIFLDGGLEIPVSKRHRAAVAGCLTNTEVKSAP